jgi:hypothetical protein
LAVLHHVWTTDRLTTTAGFQLSRSFTMPHFKPTLAAAIVAILACAPPAPVTTGPDPEPADAGRPISPEQPWAIRTREHVDLWLHGFAMVQDDTSRLPLFRRGYREQMIVTRNAANVTTLLDTNREQLRTRFTQNTRLYNAQFVALYFANATDLRNGLDLFLRADGNPQRAGSREAGIVISTLAGYFPGPADRDWARLFWQSLSDESTRFYRDYWLRQQRERELTLAAADSLWQNVHRPRLQRFLDNSQQSTGALLLSLPLDGEGRSLNLGPNQGIVAVTFPDRPADALDATYVAVHELVIPITTSVVTDNLTPAEQRSGLLDRYSMTAAVRGGAILLQRQAPEIADGYARYYLRAVNAPAGANVQASLAAAFPLTETIREAIVRQFDIIMSGI